jgi:integrase
MMHRPEVMRPLSAYEVDRIARTLLARKSPEAARDCLLLYAGIRRGQRRISSLLGTLTMRDVWDFAKDMPVDWPPLNALEQVAAQRWFRYLKRQHLLGKGRYGPDELLCQSRKGQATTPHRPQISRQTVWNFINKAAISAGIDPTSLGSESLRKTAADRLHREDPDNWGKKKRGLGHARAISTFQYLGSFKAKAWDLPADEFRDQSRALVLLVKDTLSTHGLDALPRQQIVEWLKRLGHIAHLSKKHGAEAALLFEQLLSSLESRGQLF